MKLKIKLVLSITVFLKDMLDSFVRIEQCADGSVMVERIDQQCDIFAHVTVYIIWFFQKLRDTVI